jgi:hypothetical protein
MSRVMQERVTKVTRKAGNGTTSTGIRSQTPHDRSKRGLYWSILIGMPSGSSASRTTLSSPTATMVVR